MPQPLLARRTTQGKGLLFSSHELLRCHIPIPSQGLPATVLLLSLHQEFPQRCHLTTQAGLVTLSSVLPCWYRVSQPFPFPPSPKTDPTFEFPHGHLLPPQDLHISQMIQQAPPASHSIYVPRRMQAAQPSAPCFTRQQTGSTVSSPMCRRALPGAPCFSERVPGEDGAAAPALQRGEAMLWKRERQTPKERIARFMYEYWGSPGLLAGLLGLAGGEPRPTTELK